jgi:hypothetical protein
MTDNVERQLAAERRGWVFSGQQATLVEADEDDVRGRQFTGDGDDPLADLLEKIEAFDGTNGRV